MSGRRFRVLLAIGFHDRGKGCFARQSLIARETGLRREHVSREIGWLQDAGYITAERRGRLLLLRVIWSQDSPDGQVVDFQAARAAGGIG